MRRRGTGPLRPTSRDLDIRFEDEAIVVVNKPAGLLSVPLARRETAPSLAGLIEERYRSHRARRVFAVHRIDRDTSGLVVFARHARAQHTLRDQFARHEPERVYWAVVHGQLTPPSGTWRDRLVWDQKALVQKSADTRDPSAAEAISEYRLVESFPDASLIEVRLHTGKRNQIRIQAALHGHPLVGERQYTNEGDDSVIDFARQALHAYRLTFRHPTTGRLLAFEAPLPKDLVDLLERLRRRL